MHLAYKICMHGILNNYILHPSIPLRGKIANIDFELMIAIVRYFAAVFAVDFFLGNILLHFLEKSNEFTFFPPMNFLFLLYPIF